MNRMALKVFQLIYMCWILTSRFLNIEKPEGGLLHKVGMSCNSRKSLRIMTPNGTSWPASRNPGSKVLFSALFMQIDILLTTRRCCYHSIWGTQRKRLCTLQVAPICRRSFVDYWKMGKTTQLSSTVLTTGFGRLQYWHWSSSQRFSKWRQDDVQQNDQWPTTQRCKVLISQFCLIITVMSW